MPPRYIVNLDNTYADIRETKMTRSFAIAFMIIGTIGGALHARGFGGGIRGGGALATGDISGPGDFWGNGAYGTGGLPWFVGLPGANTAYGGFFSGPPQNNLSKGPANYHPLAGEQAMAAPQFNPNAQRQAFMSSLAGMGIQTGGFRPGQFGPPPPVNQESDAGLPSDLGLHESGGKHPSGSARDGGPSDVTAATANIAGAQNGGPTRNWSTADLRVLGNSARSKFRDYNVFGRDWFAQYPGAWSTRGYARGVWTPADWADITAWSGGDWPLYEYTFGDELTYENNDVCLDGRPIATAAKYYDSAAAIAQVGERAKNQRDSGAASWLPLGVFEAIPSGKTSSPMLLQLAVNKAGIIRGNYFDPPAKNMQLIQGSLDKDTGRAAWIVADKKNIIFDCVLYNLTKRETPVLVHMGKDKAEQWVLVRLTQQNDGR